MQEQANVHKQNIIHNYVNGKITLARRYNL